ncbi:hypothetical protein JCM18899A_18500 [Nocardioides sp. AN3]
MLVVVLLAAWLLLGAPRASAAGASDPVGAWPLSPTPQVVRRFDPPATRWASGHRGVDLLGRAGQRVRTALPGKVVFAGALAGRGVVVVEHGETRTTYEPVSPSVALGDTLATGDVLGTLTAGGSHCLPRACLHWGWIRDLDDTYLDPLRLVGVLPVRLLPLWRDDPAGAGGSPPRSSAGPSSAGRAPTPLQGPYAAWRPPLLRLVLTFG